jgi:hypothetical protein
MDFRQMKESLEQAYERNVQVARALHFSRMEGLLVVGEFEPGYRRIPVLSGLPGIGKTSCAQDFATEKKFEFVELDCSYMPPETLATLMHAMIHRILKEEIKGCVFLVDNIDQADTGWRHLCQQYAKGYLDTLAEGPDPENTDAIDQPHLMIPEELFLVGEQRPPQPL